MIKSILNSKLKKVYITLLLSLFVVSSIFPVSLSQLRIVADDGTFLGTFESEYSSNSIYNQYGNFGSPYGSNSIMNKYSSYGSDYSQYSPFNAYSNNGPWLVDIYGNRYGRLSINKYAPGVTSDSYRIALQLKAIRDSY